MVSRAMKCTIFFVFMFIAYEVRCEKGHENHSQTAREGLSDAMEGSLAGQMPTATDEVDYDTDNDDHLDDENIDIQQSASSMVESIKNQSDLGNTFANLLKNHNFHTKLDKFRSDPNFLSRIANQNKMIGDLLSTSPNKSENFATRSGSVSSDEKQVVEGKTYDIVQLKKFYDKIKSEELQESPSSKLESPIVSASIPYIADPHENHNYFSSGEWQPVISTHENRFMMPLVDSSHHQETVVTAPMPISLANFYVDAEHRLMHAYESQNKDQKETKDTSNSNMATTVKDLISTKENNKVTKQGTDMAHKDSGGYVPVLDDGKYGELLNCCDQLFKNYASKDYIHEDVYLVPRDGGDMQRYGSPHATPMMTMMGSRGLMKPYVRGGFPIIEHDDRDIVGKHAGKHMPVHCIGGDHSGHFAPAYHARHPPPSMYRGPPPAWLLKKKLALIGKKYLLMGK